MLKDQLGFKLRAAILLMLTAVLVGGVAVGADDGTRLSKGELKNLVATAKTAADHERLAGYFDAKAAQLESDAKDHDELAQEYKRNPTVSRRVEKSQSYEHCRELARDFAKAAQDARRLAADHRAMAKEAK
jgi:hypothetical protein